MGPFWAGLAAYHFLPFLRRTTVVPPAKGGVTARHDAGGGRYAIEAKAPRSFDAASHRHRFAPCFLR